MTPEAQRIAIAEACGWKRVREDSEAAMKLREYPSTFLVGVHPINQREGWENSTTNSWLLPNYLHDLNAMHEAEKVLTDEQHALFLSYLTLKDQKSLTQTFWPAIHSTAAQRAEAFLRTIGKWELTVQGSEERAGQTSVEAPKPLTNP